MKHFMKNRYNHFVKEFLQECFERIALACSVCPQGRLSFGNSVTTMDRNENGEYVPYLSVNGDKPVELYSDDGYNRVEDIALWADICTDFVHSKAAGEKEYSSTWNKQIFSVQK